MSAALVPCAARASAWLSLSLSPGSAAMIGEVRSVFADHRRLSGEPGTRVPHQSIGQSGLERTTLDLFDRDFVLLGGSEDWRLTAENLSDEGFRLRFVQFDKDITGNDLPRAFGLNVGGAALVRPDGFVAWRLPNLPDNPKQRLREVIQHLGLQGARR